MAISFTSKDSGNVLLIGGQSSLSGVTGGSIGPFPRYSISREDLTAADGTYLNTRFSINITGTAVLKSTEDQDITTRGERQNAVQGESIINFQFNRSQWPMHGAGKLEITAYGGGANAISFDDAKLTSLDLPEQTEESSGIQNLEYGFTFEAYEDASSSSTAGSITKVDPTYLLSTVDESWDLALEEGGPAFYASSDISETVAPGSPTPKPQKVYTLTHTVSATGLKKFGAVGLDTDGEAWRQAVKWVGTRLIDDPYSATYSTIAAGSFFTKDIVGNTNVTNFNPFTMDKHDDSSNLGIDLQPHPTGTSASNEGNNYETYDHVRVVSNNMAEGSYTVTDTWLLVNVTSTSGRRSVLHDVEVSYEESQEAVSATITVSGTITGLETNDASNNTITKYDNAVIELPYVLEKVHALAAKVYAVSSPLDEEGNPVGTLRSIELNKSVGHNKIAGTITYSIGYDDATCSLKRDASDGSGPEDHPGCLSESITVNYDNEDGADQIIAIIGVIGKADGPVIQNMGTTKEKKISVSLDIVMDKDNRSTKPDGTSVAEAYRPAVETITSYQAAKTESWAPNTGAYSLNIEWIYI